MHDPYTVAFEMRYPWRARRYRQATSAFLRTYHDPFITIWHKDPERGGDEDSCDWFWRHFNARQAAALDDLVTNPDDNIQSWFSGSYAETDTDEMRRFVRVVAAHTRRVILRRPWWDTPRWHLWHWRLQVHPAQRLWRWLFDRCATCGKRFGWDEPVVSAAWEGKGDLHHMRCKGWVVAQEPLLPTTTTDTDGENVPA